MIRYEKSGHIATITIDSPPLNVLNPDMHKQLYEVLTEFTADRDIHCGILTGAGDRAFSAGDDIKTKRPERTRLEKVERHLNPSRSYDSNEYPGWEHEILTMPRYKPIIGAVNGYCFGQGFIYLNALTDIRYASTSAVLGMPEIAYGMGGAAAAIGMGKALNHVAVMELVLLGEKISAEKAMRLGLLNDVVAPDKLMETAQVAAEKIASHPPLGIRVEMESYQRSLDMSRADGLALAGHMYHLARSVQSTEPPLAKKDAAE